MRHTRTRGRPPTPRGRPAAGSVGPVVEVSELAKYYADRAVVDHVDLQIAEGEIFGLLGANGAGKTTTVECLQGLRRADEGSIRVLGLDPVVDRARLRSVIGSQLQNAALPERIRVGEAVALFDRSDGERGRAELERWDLAPLRRTAFGDLSGGQRQRLFIALALLNRPRLVFLDEVTQGLDPAARRDTWDVIRQVRDDGATVILVSHFADEVEALCDRVAVMRAGNVVELGTVRQLVDRHAPRTTVTFTPPAAFDPVGLARLPGVHTVRRSGERVEVSGTTALIGPICAACLDDHGHGPSDLTVRHPSLDDALVELIGSRS